MLKIFGSVYQVSQGPKVYPLSVSQVVYLWEIHSCQTLKTIDCRGTDRDVKVFPCNKRPLESNGLNHIKLIIQLIFQLVIQTFHMIFMWRSVWLCGEFNHWSAGGHLSIKMSSYRYRDPYVKDKTVTVLSLTRESPYLGKMVFILRWEAQVLNIWCQAITQTSDGIDGEDQWHSCCLYCLI